MQERLNKITEDFQAAYDLKKEIESKIFLTDNDKEELEIIETWLEEFRNQINEWAEEYNKENNLTEVIDEPKEKTLREQFEENRIKIDEIKYESKSMQPKFQSSEKKNKYEILNSLGFVETKTVDDRKIMIHPSLVGKYYDLVKEQKIIIDKLKEEYKEKSKVILKDDVLEIKNEVINTEDQQVITNNQNQLTEEMKIKFEKNQQEIAKILDGKGLGKKDYIKYHGAKYWVPKVYKHRFIALMNEQERLSKELGLIEEQKKNSKIDEEDLINQITTGIERQLPAIIEEKDKQLPVLVGEVTQIKKGSTSLKEKIIQGKNKIKGKLAEKVKKIYEKYKEYLNKINEYKEKRNNLLEEKKEINYKKANLESLIYEIDTRLAYKNNIFDANQEEKYLQNMQELKEQAQKELEIIEQKREVINAEIKNIRKPKTNIEGKAKKNIKKTVIKIALFAGLTLGVISSLKSCKINQNNQETNQIVYETESPVQTTEPQNLNTNETGDDKKQETTIKQSPENKNKQSYYSDTEVYNVSGNIYDNMVSANEKSNPQHSYFGENTEATILGWGIDLNGEMVYVARNDTNYQEKIDYYLEQGGKVTTYAMNNTNSDQMNVITGFYNAEQVSAKHR